MDNDFSDPKHQGGETGSVRQAHEETAPNETGKSRKIYEIDIYRDWCKSCGLCSAFCPNECISVDEDGFPTVEKSDRCTGCGWCEAHCPDFAISVHARKCSGNRESDEDRNGKGE